MQDVERAADRQAALHAWLERDGLPRLQPDRCRHVAHVIGVVRVALDSLEDPPPVPFWQGLDGEDEVSPWRGLCGQSGQDSFRSPK